MSYTIQIDAAIPNLKAANKQQVFRALAQRAAQDMGCSQDMLVERLMEREEQSNAGIGDGVAIPHLKAHGIPRRFVIIANLINPVEFGAIDDQPVDLVCMLLSPSSHGGLHLRGLSRISRLFKNKELCQKLREAHDEDTMRALFLNPDGWLLAA